MKMKKIRSVVITVIILAIVVGMGQVRQVTQTFHVNWVTIEEAQKLNKKEPRKIMVDVYTKWCGPCKMMVKYTINDEWTSKYINEHFYAVKFDAEGPDSCIFKNTTFKNPGHVKNKPGRNATHQFTKAIAPVNGRIAYPTVVFIDEELNLITPVQGFQKPAQFEPMLKFVKENKYKTTTWTEYMKTFKSDRTVAATPKQ